MVHKMDTAPICHRLRRSGDAGAEQKVSLWPGGSDEAARGLVLLVVLEELLLLALPLLELPELGLAEGPDLALLLLALHAVLSEFL